MLFKKAAELVAGLGEFRGDVVAGEEAAEFEWFGGGQFLDGRLV
jgi:hypothetical protein